MPEQTYRRGIGLLVLLTASLLCILGAWARMNWAEHLALAQIELQRLAAVNSLPVALAVRDARRIAETVDVALATEPVQSADDVRARLKAALAVHASHGELADLFQGGSFSLLGYGSRRL